MVKKPFQEIKDQLVPILSNEQCNVLPKKWEKIGDVLILSLDEKLLPIERNVAKVYADVLSCKSVLKDVGGINGPLRQPKVSLLYGDEDTITIHKENGVKYKLDPAKIMFSSGNMDERKRMGELECADEIVVDLFAGIGYFSLPIAVHGGPKKVFSCELNPISFSFLKENIVLNQVSDIVTPLVGDNRNVAPRNIADRVLMGFFGDTHKYLPVAFQSLYYHNGIIHFHDTFPDKEVPDIPFSLIKQTAKQFHCSVTLQHIQKVKSFAPGISHYVFDVLVEES